MRKIKRAERNPYGDLIGWFQICDHASSEKKSIIFVTDDVKEGWFEWIDERKFGPGAELRRELRERAKVDFYIYDSAQFAKYANAHIETKVKEQSIREASKLTSVPHLLKEYSQSLVRQNSMETAKRMYTPFSSNLAEDELSRLLQAVDAAIIEVKSIGNPTVSQIELLQDSIRRMQLQLGGRTAFEGLLEQQYRTSALEEEDDSE